MWWRCWSPPWHLTGTVVLVLWTALANLGDSHGVYFDQWIICNHAAVAFWQQHVYLNFIDPDEYLATENKMTVPQMIKTCFGEGADMYRFLIYNVAVGSGMNTIAHVTCLFATVSDNILTTCCVDLLPLLHRPFSSQCEGCVYSERRTIGERDLWLKPNVTDPLKRYTRMHIPEGRGSKIFMNPNYALTLYNHFANMEPNAIVTCVVGAVCWESRLSRPTTTGKWMDGVPTWPIWCICFGIVHMLSTKRILATRPRGGM